MRDAIVSRRFSVFVWTGENDSWTRILSQTEEKTPPFSKISGYLHGTKNWIYCTFDTSQKLSQIWYWL